MRKHEIALHYAEQAVQILDREYEARYPNEMGSETERLKFASVVATAYHNAAVEYEFTGDFSTSLIMYQKAVRVSKIHLGVQHPLTETFESNFESVKERIKKNPSIISQKPSRIQSSRPKNFSELGSRYGNNNPTPYG